MYFKEFLDLLVKNEIKKESELLTGNSDDFSSFQNKKRKYKTKSKIDNYI